MELWRNVWRKGFVPVLSTAGLVALREARQNDDPRLVQGATTTPPPLLCVQDWPVEACCALGYCGWQGDDLHTVGEVEEHFAKCCFEADERLNEPAGCRHFLNWFDDTPRTDMVRDLLNEVELALTNRVFTPAATTVTTPDVCADETLVSYPVNRVMEFYPALTR